MQISNEKKFKILVEDYTKNFTGWDFSYIEATRRIQEFPLSWSYRSLVLNYLLNATTLLDIGTGGGEFLSSLAPLSKITFASESYPPNVEVATKKLNPLRIDVIKTDESGDLPFQDDFFDLIISRHAYYNPDEVQRILKINGFFITQQVGNQNAQELNQWFHSITNDSAQWNAKKAATDLAKSGFALVDSKEIITKTRFYDIGAILYFLKAIPWQIPSFTIEKYYSKMINLHNLIETHGFYDVTCHRFLLIAKKEGRNEKPL
jgi:SAM-dependent methyltransferase